MSNHSKASQGSKDLCQLLFDQLSKKNSGTKTKRD